MSTLTKFITDDFEKTIKINVINKTYPNLNSAHQNILSTYLYGLIQMSATCHDFYSDKTNFISKLTQNSFKDLRWMLTFLLPFMNQNIKKVYELRDLNELYTLRYDKNKHASELATELKIEDINLTAPKYVFSNLQYGRCERNYQEHPNSIKSAHSLAFNEQHLRDNYYLLLNTILTIRNKMYINWIDILPYRMDNYRTTRLYIQTKDLLNNNKIQSIDLIEDYPIDKIRDSQQISVLNSKIQGMNIEDMYNTISLDLYESIVKYKWLLFDVSISDNSKNIVVPIINALSGVINLIDLLYETPWSNLIEKAQIEFVVKWGTVVTAFEKSKQLVTTNSVIYNDNSVNTIVKYIVVFFDRKYSKLSTLSKNKKYVPLDKIKMKDITREMILKTVKSIDPPFIYDFLLECIQGLKKTWYSLRLMSPDKKTLTEKHQYEYISDTKYVSFKNVYNFCKSMVHETNNDGIYTRLPLTWAEQNVETKKEIIKRFNDPNNIDTWFNIRRNMKTVLRLITPNTDIDDQTINTRMKFVYDEIRLKMPDIMFEASITKGTLSYMTAETDLTDNATYDMTNIESKKKFVNMIAKRRFSMPNPYGENSYYYLTEKPFNDTGEYFIKIEDTPAEYDYFKLNSTTKTAWYTFTTYHWIAQLGFCHRFINNRVNYITGGTGAGKSTQVPKMFMYYLKAIDRIPDPTVVVTVPRTGVATSVSSFVSNELAVPIEEYDRKTGKKNPNQMTKNHYVQFKHMADNNVDNGHYPKIRFITDGSVMADAKDPWFKNKKMVNDQVIYFRNNQYDVVIVDEAHEHNANMDMILTLMRNAVYYNNTVRLVIMSATMDSDEQTYRRFYRDVNDNRKYPLNDWIRQHKLDRINTERRFHISPPDETTRFKITEFYRPGANPNDIVIEILANFKNGDILLFEPGIKEISEVVTFLNGPNIMPPDVIALPFHAQLPKNVGDFVKDIAKNLKDLRIDKQTDFSTASASTLTTGTNIYNRAVLVATNIAEASITIDTLRYVIDTGLEKTMRFDFESRSNILITNYINETSRIQRKGRVGRVAPGTVYYIYPERSLIDNVKQFNIAVQDIHQSVMLELLRDPFDVPIMTDLINSIVSGFSTESTIKDLFTKYGSNVDFETSVKSSDGSLAMNKDSILKLIKIDLINHYEFYKKTVDDTIIKYINSIVDIIGDQYVSGNGLNGLYDYYGNDTQYDYLNALNTSQGRPIPKLYFSGFDIEQLTDSLGEFYIVHPDELVIKRNIIGEVVGADQYQVVTKKYDAFRQKMISNKIIVFWETLINSAFIGIKTLPSGSTKSTKSTKSKIIFRTELGQLLRYCMKNLTDNRVLKNESLINMLFYGYGLSKNDEEFERVLSMVAMLDTIGSENITKKLMNTSFKDAIKDTTKDTTKTPSEIRRLEAKYITLIKSTFVNCNKTIGIQSVNESDIQLIDCVVQFIQRIFEQNNVEYNLFKSPLLTNTKFKEENIVDIQKGVPKSSKTEVVITSQQALAQRNDLLKNIGEVHAKELGSIIGRNRDMILNTGLSVNIISKYVITKEKIRRLWNDVQYDVKNLGDTKDMNISELKGLIKPYRDLMDKYNIDLLKGVIMLSKPYSIKRKISNTTSSYASVYNPNPNTIMTLSPNSTFTDPPYYQNYILNLSESLEYKIMTIILDVRIEDMYLLANIYNRREMKRKLSSQMLTADKKHLYMTKYIKDQYPDKPTTTDDTTSTTNTTNTTNTTTSSNVDFRAYNIPEHIIAVSNLNNTSQIILNDIQSIQKSEVFNILEKLGSEYADYRSILQKV